MSNSKDSPRPVGTVAVWGTFDVDNYGDLLFPRITEREITRRLDGWRVRPFSPFGHERPLRMDGGFLAEPLGDWDPVRVRQLSEAADLTLIGGGEIIHFNTEAITSAYDSTPEVMAARAPGRYFVDGLGAEYEKDHPVVWNAVGIPEVPAPEQAAMIKDALARREYVAVRDPLSLERLRACGVEQDVDVVPDLGFLLDRLVDPGVLEERLRYLRFMGWYPKDKPALIVQANRSAVHLADEIARVVDWMVEESVPGAEVVLLETGPCHGDDLFVDAMLRRLPGRTVHRLPGALPVEDVLAAIHGSAGVAAMSFHANIAAFVYGKPWVVLDFAQQSKMRALVDALEAPDQRAVDMDTFANAVRAAFGRAPRPDLLRSLQARVDAHFDRVAELAFRSWRDRGGDPAARIAELARQNELLRRAYGQLRQRQNAERIALVDELEKARVDLDRIRADWKRAQEEITARLGHDSRELQALRNTKLYRWSDPLRSVYGRMRRS